MVKAAPPAQPPGSAADPAINLCVAGYDGSVANLSMSTDPSDNLLSLSATFAYAAHTGAVRSAALCGPTLVTGSADDTIRIYNLARRVEAGTLFMHNGTVNALKFARDGSRNVLFSASDDATICVWRLPDWQCLKRLSGHQAPVLDVAVHPSSRLALSVSKDRSLFMWNLVKGRIAFSAKTKGQPASRVAWSRAGDTYLLASGSAVTLSNVEGRTVSSFTHEKEVHEAVFLQDGRVATGGEERIVKLWDARQRDPVLATTHDARVRGLSVVGPYLFSGDSKGVVKVWDARAGRVRLQTSVGGGDMRLTCLAAASEVREAEDEVAVQGDDEKSGKVAKGRKKRGPKANDEAESSIKLDGTASQRKRKKRKNAS